MDPRCELLLRPIYGTPEGFLIFGKYGFRHERNVGIDIFRRALIEFSHAYAQIGKTPGAIGCHAELKNNARDGLNQFFKRLAHLRRWFFLICPVEAVVTANGRYVVTDGSSEQAVKTASESAPRDEGTRSGLTRRRYR